MVLVAELVTMVFAVEILVVCVMGASLVVLEAILFVVVVVMVGIMPVVAVVAAVVEAVFVFEVLVEGEVLVLALLPVSAFAITFDIVEM